MPWTTPGTAVAGAVLSSAFWNEQVRDNSLMGNPVFTNEAARDAAISSPVEGQRCYLTTPTVPAATGNTTFVPTGVTTIYNGSVWVCTTPVGARGSFGTPTTTSTSYVTTLTGDGTAVSVTLVTGTTALISYGFRGYNNAFNYATFSVSGATTISAATNDDYRVGVDNGGNVSQSSWAATIIFGGLTAGTNTFTLNYKTSTGTMTFTHRHLSVTGIA